jgi:uncharacterized protein (TIGR01244 family)
MFTSLIDGMFVAPQISSDDVAAAAAQGIGLIINNRPDGESADQPSGAEIEAAARAAGLSYVAIPITHSGFSQPQVAAMVDALETAQSGVLAYCRSGTRSTLLWALAQAQLGADSDDVSDIAAAAGYDVSAIRPLMDMLKAQA